MKKMISLTISFLLIFSLLSCQPTYNEKCNWYCDNETFENQYITFCNDEIARLIEKYSLTCNFEYENDIDDDDDLAYDLYIYSEDYTVAIHMANCNRGDTGFYHLQLFYYNDDMLNENHDDIKPVVEFANEITNIIAYDTKTEENQFEKLYYEALNSEKKYASNYYHFDNAVGNVGYYVNVGEDAGGTSAGYYYMLQKHSSIKQCYHFTFEGLLKPFNAE